jgi:alpha-amylase
MNWDAIKSNPETQNIVALAKLGQFRKNHPSVGAGIHQISTQPYTFQNFF